MASFNRIILVGSLTEDPEIRVTNGGISMSKFTVSVDRPARVLGEATSADFIQVTAWRELAEEIQQSARKGALAYLEGTIRTDSYETPQGEKRYATKVEANRFKVLTGGSTSSPAALSDLPPLESVGAPLKDSDFDFGGFSEKGPGESNLNFGETEEIPF